MARRGVGRGGRVHGGARVVYGEENGSTEPSSSSSTTRPATVHLTVPLRGEDNFQLYDLKGDYKYHNQLLEVWQPYFQAQTIEVYPKHNELAGALSNATDDWETQKGEGKRPLVYWAGKDWLNDPDNNPAVGGAPNYVDADGYDIPAERVFQHRKFNRSESTYAIKFYQIAVASDKCAAAAKRACPPSSTVDSGYTMLIDNDQGVRDCLEGIPADCSINISGYWNFTAPHAPELCCSNTFGLQFPSPGQIVPLTECKYGDIVVRNFVPYGSLRDNYDVDDMYLTPDWYNLRGKKPLGSWNIMQCLNPAAEPYSKGCQARLQFGTGSIADKLEQCQPSAIGPSLAVVGGEDYYFFASDYPTEQWDLAHRNASRWMIDDLRLNLAFKTQRLLDRYGDHNVGGFVFDWAAGISVNWCGPFAGVEVPFTCATHGFADYFVPKGH